MKNTKQLIVNEIPCLRRYARALLRDPEMADDLVQDCLERALSRIKLWNQGSNIKSWLLTIMHNIYVNNVRSSKAKPGLLSLDENLLELNSPDNQENSIFLNQVNMALDLLPVEQREVLLLVGLEGMGYQEVSEILSIPLGTVMSRLHRARERVRVEMHYSPPPSSHRRNLR